MVELGWLCWVVFGFAFVLAQMLGFGFWVVFWLGFGCSGFPSLGFLSLTLDFSAV